MTLDHTKAYNAHRLEEETGGRWYHGRDRAGFQDHWFVAPDGSIWRPRTVHHYYSVPSGKLMMVCRASCEPRDRSVEGY